MTISRFRWQLSSTERRLKDCVQFLICLFVIHPRNILCCSFWSIHPLEVYLDFMFRTSIQMNTEISIMFEIFSATHSIVLCFANSGRSTIHMNKLVEKSILLRQQSNHSIKRWSDITSIFISNNNIICFIAILDLFSAKNGFENNTKS